MATTKTLPETEAPNAGEMLRSHIKGKRIYRSVLARKLNRPYTTVMSYEKNKSLQTRLLWELSLVLKHNFFLDLAAQLPPEFTTYAPDTTLALQERIVSLKEENKLLTARLDECRGMMRKG